MKVSKQEVLKEARAWAAAHDAATLQTIADNEAALLEAAQTTEQDPSAALALARRFDVVGVKPEILSALRRAETFTVGADRARVRLALATAHFELGELETAAALWESLVQANGDPEVIVIAAFARARVQVLTDGDASSLMEQAKALYRSSENTWPWVDAMAFATEASMEMGAGRRRKARELWERAFEAALSYDGAVEGAVCAGFLGNLELDESRVEAAEKWFGAAVRLGQKVQSQSVTAVFGGYQAWCWELSGETERAMSGYAKAIALAREMDLVRFATHFEILAAVSYSDPRDPVERELSFRAALSELQKTGDCERADGLRVLQSHFDVYRATNSGSVQEAHRHWIRACLRIREASPRSDDGRIAARHAQQEFQAALRQHLDDLGNKSADANTLDMYTDGSGGSIGGTSLNLSQNPTLARLLWALVDGWADQRAVKDTELLAQTWPGERLTASSAARRLQVAVSTLRKKGLKEILVRRKDGYALECELVRVVPELESIESN